MPTSLTPRRFVRTTSQIAPSVMMTASGRLPLKIGTILKSEPVKATAIAGSDDRDPVAPGDEEAGEVAKSPFSMVMRPTGCGARRARRANVSPRQIAPPPATQPTTGWRGVRKAPAPRATGRSPNRPCFQRQWQYRRRRPDSCARGRRLEGPASRGCTGRQLLSLRDYVRHTRCRFPPPDTVVPASPARILARSARAPIAALLPVAAANRQAASTFGPMDPAANCVPASAGGEARRMALCVGFPNPHRPRLCPSASRTGRPRVRARAARNRDPCR